MTDNNTTPNNTPTDHRIARVMATCRDTARGTMTQPYVVLADQSVGSAGRYLWHLHQLSRGQAATAQLVVGDDDHPERTELEVTRRVCQWRYWVEVDQ